MMKCEHDNCLTCPYPDCISPNRGPAKKEKKKPGRKRLPPEVVKQNRKEYSRKYYAEHKAERSAYYKEYNKKNAERVRERQRAYDSKRGYSKEYTTIWMTNGLINRRIPVAKKAEFEAKGWQRGRISRK